MSYYPTIYEQMYICMILRNRFASLSDTDLVWHKSENFWPSFENMCENEGETLQNPE